MTPRTLAGAALAAALLDDATLDDAIAAVCVEYGVTPEQVVAAVRACRYVVFNSTRSGPVADALLSTAPDDVIPIPYGVTPSEETAQQRVLAQLGAVVTHLPSLVAYVPAYDVVTDEGTVAVPAGYRELRLRPGAAWSDDEPPPDRLRPLVEWGLCRNPPPATEE